MSRGFNSRRFAHISFDSKNEVGIFAACRHNIWLFPARPCSVSSRGQRCSAKTLTTPSHLPRLALHVPKQHRVPPLLHRRQEQQPLLNPWSQMQQVHDLIDMTRPPEFSTPGNELPAIAPTQN